MENPRPEKVAVVDEVRERFERADAALLTEYRGLNVKALADLRRQLRPAGGEYKIYKNTLVRFAAREAGADELEELLTGPTAIAFVHGDAAAVAKALRDFARTNPHAGGQGRPARHQGAHRRPTSPALADLPPREVAAGPPGRRPPGPARASSPACSRPCPATSPTASRPSSTTGRRPPSARRRGRRAADAAADAAPTSRRPPTPPRQPPTTDDATETPQPRPRPTSRRRRAHRPTSRTDDRRRPPPPTTAADRCR